MPVLLFQLHTSVELWLVCLERGFWATTTLPREGAKATTDHMPLLYWLQSITPRISQPFGPRLQAVPSKSGSGASIRGWLQDRWRRQLESWSKMEVTGAHQNLSTSSAEKPRCRRPFVAGRARLDVTVAAKCRPSKTGFGKGSKNAIVNRSIILHNLSLFVVCLCDL